MTTVWKAADKLKKLIKRQRNKCAICNQQMKAAHKLEPTSATLDHRIPRSKGGTGSLPNLRATCRQCNMKKGDSDEEDYRS